MAKRFDGVLFDAGGIFVVPDPAATAMVLAPFGGTSDHNLLVRSHYAGMEALDAAASERTDASIDRITWDIYRRAYVAAAGVEFDHEAAAANAMRRLFSPYYWRFPLLESVAALAQLHYRRVPIGVVSNASGQIEATLANLCICQVGPGAGVPVSIVTDSAVIGFAKPDPRIFREAIAELNLAPARIAYVGDSFVNDVAAARAAGLVPILYDPFDDHARYDCERVHSLHEVLEFVE
jgi:putative hydrolase of the HAD superfamily